jgi:hypothetical protein
MTKSLKLLRGQRQFERVTSGRYAAYFLASSMCRTVSFFKYLSQDMLSQRCTPKLSVHFSPRPSNMYCKLSQSGLKKEEPPRTCPTVHKQQGVRLGNHRRTVMSEGQSAAAKRGYLTLCMLHMRASNTSSNNAIHRTAKRECGLDTNTALHNPYSPRSPSWPMAKLT